MSDQASDLQMQPPVYAEPNADGSAFQQPVDTVQMAAPQMPPAFQAAPEQMAAPEGGQQQFDAQQLLDNL